MTVSAGPGSATLPCAGDKRNAAASAERTRGPGDPGSEAILKCRPEPIGRKQKYEYLRPHCVCLGHGKLWPDAVDPWIRFIDSPCLLPATSVSVRMHRDRDIPKLFHGVKTCRIVRLAPLSGSTTPRALVSSPRKAALTCSC